MKCQSGGFSPRVAIALVRSFVISIATYGAVIWNNASCAPDTIEDKLTEIYGDILGCQRNTPSVLVRAELGCKSQRCERDLCSLMYLRRLLALPDSRLTKQIYAVLMHDHRRGCLSARPNWATCTMPALLSRYQLSAPRRLPPLATWKRSVREAVIATDEDTLVPSTTKNTHYLSFRSSRGMPFYLTRRCTWFVNYGRSIKTRLRCATHALEIDNGRRSGVINRNERLCPCCPLQETETERHFMLDCPLYSDDRLAFTDAVDELVLHYDPFRWRTMSWDQRYQFLLRDSPAEA